MKFLLTAISLVLAVLFSTAQPFRINEVMSSNGDIITDSDGDTPDWIELYNAGTAAVNVNGYGLSDKNDLPFQWVFPDLQIRPGEYLLVFASGKDRRQAPAYWNTVISKGDEWKYLAPKSEPATNWRFNEFNDTSWLTGKSGFGFGDDGFVAYLNGQEIARANMVDRGQYPDYSALATGQHEAVIYQGMIPEKFVIDNPSVLLKAGENVLAIQGHNVFSTSTDLSVIPFLSIGTTEPPVSPRKIAILNLETTQLHTNFKLDADG